MTDEEQLQPALYVQEIVGTFLCVCQSPLGDNNGGSTDIDDCTLPSEVTCEHCGRTWRLHLSFEPRLALA